MNFTFKPVINKSKHHPRRFLVYWQKQPIGMIHKLTYHWVSYNHHDAYNNLILFKTKNACAKAILQSIFTEKL